MAEELLSDQLERALLALLVQDGEKIYEIEEKLSPYMFATAGHEIIYRAMLSVIGADRQLDYYMLLDELNKDQDSYNLAGGKKYLDFLMELPVTVDDISGYVRRIQENFKNRALRSLGLSIPKMLRNEKDANTVIHKLVSSLDDLIDNTNRSEVLFVGDEIEKTFQQILERRKNPGIPGVSTGFKSIDQLTGGFVEGDIWYIGARPQMAKSSLLAKMVLYLGKEQIPSLVFNKEMSIPSIHQRMLSIVSGVELTKIITGYFDDAEEKRIAHAKSIIEKMPILFDHNYGGGIDYTVSTIQKYHRLHGVRVVGIDYIQLLTGRGPEATQELGDASRKIKIIANELGITQVVLSQLNRECEKRLDDKRPIMSDLRQSGNLEEDADIMVALYRDDQYNQNSPDENKIEFIIRKARNGPLGTIILDFIPEIVNVYDQLDFSWENDNG